MTRKRRRSTMNECNNNDSDTIPREKRRRTMEQRLMAQLQSNLTDKMILPITSPDGQLTSRSGRRITKFESPNNRIKKMMTPPSNTRSKRKVRKLNSIHNINASLRFVSNHQSSVLANSPIQKLISLNKTGLNNDHFQTQLNEISVCTNQPIIDLCTEVSTYETNCIAQMDEKMDRNETSAGTETFQMAIDYEDDLKTFHLVGPMKLRARAESIQIVEEVDLTLSSTDGSVGGDDDKTNNNESEQLTPTPFPLSEADSTSSPPPPAAAASAPTPAQLQLQLISNASRKKTDMPKLIEIINLSNPISDCAISTSGSDAISVFDKPFSECTSDDCIIADSGESDSTDNWHIGQIVWAALASFPFWPAVVFNCEDEHAFQKGETLFSKWRQKYKYNNYIRFY